MTIEIVGMGPSVAFGYLFTVSIETPVLFAALQPKYSWKTKLAAGFALTACTYPFICFVFPAFMSPYDSPYYLPVAETFAPLAECFIFWLAFAKRESFRERGTWRDMGAIVVANLASFLLGEILKNKGVIAFIN